MGKATDRSRGFTLIAVLLLLVLLSAVAVGLMFLANNEARVGANDMEDNVAYYGAESGMEKLTADLAALYQTSMSPSPASLNNLTTFPPTAIPGLTYNESITWQPDANGNPVSTWNTISSGSNQGLVAELVPLTLQVNATRISNSSVNMTRNVEVALIPVFQFGVFSDSDLSYFAGPNFNFAGRIHTNNNLYLAGGGNLALFSKVTAFGEIVRDRLANGWPTAVNYTGTVFIPDAASGCDTSQPDTDCKSFDVPDASWGGGIPPNFGAANTATWNNVSTNKFGGFVANHATGVSPLTLPFVGKNVGPIEIVRKASTAAATTLNQSRLYTKAQVRVLLADNLADLHPDRGAGAIDADDVNLSQASINGTVFGPANGVLARANGPTDGNWAKPVNCSAADCPAGNDWALVNGFLRVEYRDAAGNWNGVTRQWLGYGFARNVNVPTAPNTGLYPNAILYFQQVADRNADGIGDNITAGGLATPTNYYPINLYDPREGEPRDNGLAGTNCRVNGVMSAVEINVGNLRRWLKGTLAGAGNNADFNNQNGYVLYFSDRRGMRVDPNATPIPNVLTGASGLEDDVNSAVPNGMPNATLEAGASGSPEDVDDNNLLDNWGAANIGDMVNVNTVANQYAATTNCLTVGRANRVTGARRALKLVDGGLGNVPTRLDNNQGGFTVASENPVYVQGDYNAGNGGGFGDPHAAAAVIADAVTLLSNNWTDFNDLNNPNNRGARAANDTYYRMAIAAGKNKTFPQPAGTGQDFGTDGGVHNFLRYIEDWGGRNLHYQGSLVSLFYSQYATGIFKCCNIVYSPPTRDYSFDTLFLNPANLPPGTPMFQDVVNLSYRQDFTPQ